LGGLVFTISIFLQRDNSDRYLISKFYEKNLEIFLILKSQELQHLMETCGKYLNLYYLYCYNSDGTLYAFIGCKKSKGHAAQLL